MLINGGPLNCAPLNGFSGSGSVPLPIARGLAFRWRLRVMVDDADVSARLTGVVSVDRERGAAGVASFVLQLEDGAVLPSEWVGRPVVVYYISTALGVTTERLRYSGRIVKTNWDAMARQLACQCGDQLQQRVEALTIEQIDALTLDCFWSVDVFEPVAGRSRWDYLQERMSTIPASLESAADGTLRVSSWYAGAAAFEFGANTTIYGSLGVSYADLTSLTNRVEIEADYRFNRLRQLNVTYTWEHPEAAGLGGIPGFCAWREDGCETPDVEMVVSSTESSGQAILNASYNRLPPSGAYCDPPAGWINNYPDLLLGAAWIASRRWSQSITERYLFTVTAEASVAAAGAVIARDRVSIEIDNDRVDSWESDPITDGETGHEDLRDEERRVSMLTCLLHQAATQILAAHTATTISWETPTSMVMDVDLTHTLKLVDQAVSAQAKCSRIADDFDLLAGTAITTLSIAVMRGGGTVSDSLTPPAAVILPQPDPPDLGHVDYVLPSQLGRAITSPVYDDDIPGFSGNYGASAVWWLPPIPRRFIVPAPEIAADLRDELTMPIPVTYRVVIPNDLLEL